MKSITRAAVLASLAFAVPVAASAQTTTGVSDTEIKLGQTAPLSGPLSAYSTFSRASLAYFKMVNDNGGIHGRRINLIIADDAFSPPKTVEQTRKLVESDEVFAIFAPVGSAPSIATQKYLNSRKVPQFLVQSGLPRWNNPKEFPWSVGGIPSYEQEVLTYAKYLTDKMPNARIAILYQNDDFGRLYLNTLTKALGEKAAQMIVAAESFDLSAPTVDSQVVNLAATKADTLLIAATAKQTIQTLQKLGSLNWRPQLFISSIAASLERTYQPAGVQNAIGAISTTQWKDPAAPESANDPDVAAYLSFMEKYYPTGDKQEKLNIAAFVEGEIISELLRRVGRDLSRESFLKQMQNIDYGKIRMVSDGIKIMTTPDNYDLFRSLELVRFDGTTHHAIDGTKSK